MRAAATDSACDQTYVANLSALWRLDATLAWHIDELGPDEVLTTESSRKGPPTVAATTPDGRRIYLHSRYDPEAEAARFAEGLAGGDHFCFVISGFGLGYHLKALHDRLPADAVLVVLEPSLPTIKTALLHTDLSSLLGSRRLVILTDADKTRLHELLNAHAPIMLLGTHFASHAASQQVAEPFYSQMRAAIADYLTFSRLSLITLVAICRATNANIAANLPAYVATPPIDFLHHHFRGFPAIVVSAGPSLARNMDRLSEARGRAVLIAVQTVFKPLLARGIVPDFVTSLDYNEVCTRFFENVDDFKNVHLIAEPKAHWKIIDCYRGPLSLLDNLFARLCLGDDLGARAGLKAGATVAHLAFYLAQYLGCDPIVFVGQDLAYTDHLFYAPGVPLHRMWAPELNRFYTLETKEWERILSRRPVLRRVQDIHGNEIFTDETLFAYLQQFESDFGAAGGLRIIDATEGGARKRGCEVMPLAEALDRYATVAIPAEKFVYRRQLKWFEASKLPAARRALAERLEQVREVRSIAEQSLDILRELTELIDQPAVFNRKLARLDELRSLMRQQDRIYGMVSGVCQLAELRKLSADLRVGRAGGSSAARAKKQLRRDMDFVEEFIDAARDLEGILLNSLRRFDAAIDAHAPRMEAAP